MLSYEKCCELRDAGFPQPVNVATGQAWYSPQVPEYPQLLSILKNVSDAEKGPVVCVTMLEMLTDPRQFYHEIDIIGNWVYCHTVEDMLSMLKSEYVLRKTEERKWAIVLVPGKGALYLEKTPLETLFEAFVDRRYLFEGYSITGGRQGSGA